MRITSSLGGEWTHTPPSYQKKLELPTAADQELEILIRCSHAEQLPNEPRQRSARLVAVELKEPAPLKKPVTRSKPPSRWRRWLKRMLQRS
jgi:hypothetical protein